MSDPIKTDLEVFFPEGKKITIAGKEFAIKPFVLKNRTKVLRIFSDIYKKFLEANPAAQSGSVNISTASEVINIAGDKLIEIYEVVLEQPREWLEENVTLHDELVIIQAIIEVNNFPLLVRQARELILGKK